MTIGVQVKLRGMNGDWSKPYTYKHDKMLEAGTKVVVPVREHYSIGEVLKSEENAEFKPGIQWKWIVQEIDFTHYNEVKNK